MGNVSSTIHRNGRGKMWKKCHKIKSQNFSNITEKVDANNLEIPFTSHVGKMNTSNDSKINLENLNAINNIENVIRLEQIGSQVVCLTRESIDLTNQPKTFLEIEQKIDSELNSENSEYNHSTKILEIDGLSTAQPIRSNHLPKSSERRDENRLKFKENSKHKGSRRKDKQMKENAPLENINDSFNSKKGILKKEELENEVMYYLATGYNINGDELPLQITNNPDSLFNTNVALKNGTATAYMLESKRKKNVRFNDNVIIVYYTAAECNPQQALRNGTFITTVMEPLKVALQQQQRNRELRNKHSYTHTVFPTTIRCGKT